ncbi:putative low-specificity L-threonine aldolase 2 [Frankliniella fusca]|uniref:Low-specificity L-threonine aldolase 2 n=1 Tax=Frankliniella fusca TaxID=407009 RepID=A0AAE1LSA2_9NEOP|nr:putative low-specificity L-threonine aldolase 2 [Frankliniella fusca]
MSCLLRKISLSWSKRLHLSLIHNPTVTSLYSVYYISKHNMYSISDPNENNDSKSIIIDLRSDTVTKPSLAMRKAMFEAEVGDDHLREDPTIETLQRKIANIFEKEAALFMPSGTMSNLIAVMAHCNSRGDKVLIGDKSHILQHEDGGVSEVGSVMIKTIPNNPDGTFDLEVMDKACCDRTKQDVSLVCIENTFGHGGSVLPIQFLDEIGSRLSKMKIPLHLDGARVFNAAVYLNVPVSRLVRDCNSVSVCLSKGLGAPVGSLLVGSEKFIERARRLRHLLGGAMRQVGVLGAPGLVALENGVKRLAEDHKKLYRIATAVDAMKSKCLFLHMDLHLIHTNIVIIRVNPNCCSADDLVKRLDKASNNRNQNVTEKEEAEIGKAIRIKCYKIDHDAIRFVTYNAITDNDIELAIQKLSYINEELQRKMD